MAFLRNLWRAELLAVLCLFAYAAGCALVTAVLDFNRAPQPPTIPPSISGAPAVMVVTFLFGLWPAMLFFAPVYALLRTRRAVNFPIAIAIGMLPAVPFYMAAPMVGLFAVFSGAVVSAATHALMRSRPDDLHRQI